MIVQHQKRHRPRGRRRHFRYREPFRTRMENQPAQKSERINSGSKDKFHQFAHRSSQLLGSPLAFLIALLLIVVWLGVGPFFHFSDTWQLVVNTATTVITFLMVFVLQNTQNRDAKAIHLKLDELVHAIGGARNRMIDLEELSDEELDQLQKEFERVRKKAPAEKCEDKQPSRPSSRESG